MAKIARILTDVGRSADILKQGFAKPPREKKHQAYVKSDCNWTEILGFSSDKARTDHLKKIR